MFLLSFVDFEQINSCCKRIKLQEQVILSQQTFTCSKSTIETIEKRCEISSNLTRKTSDREYFRKVVHVRGINKKGIFL